MVDGRRKLKVRGLMKGTLSRQLGQVFLAHNRLAVEISRHEKGMSLKVAYHGSRGSFWTVFFQILYVLGGAGSINNSTTTAMGHK